MVLAAGNVEYEDVRIAREQWAELKESKEKKKGLLRIKFYSSSSL